ncbi:hypothetical protein [Streptomyces sp. yr375]|uniref:hypothetical protein n=1 Tax=Streptomyces sp. yr375 TaxID=1761906 RepID=UPI000D1A42D7|nr:hypothetical protein [Streptomyces sp. yr375]
MLRSALAAAFSAALAFGVLSGLAAATGDTARDSTWSPGVDTVAGAGDSTWVAPRDSTWVVTAAVKPGDSTWATPGDSTWAAES